MLNAHYLSRQAGLVGPRIIFLLAWILVAPGHAFADPPKKRESKPGTAVSRPAPVFPLKKDKDGRYLVDQKGTPFLIAGESPQALMVNLTEKDAELFFASRLSHGFNAVWINLLCRKGTGGRPDGSTYDGLLPFKSPEDFAPPNEDYFARCDRMIRLAEKYGLLVILDPCETIDHLKPMLVQSLGVVSLSPLRDVVSETLAGRLAMPGLFDDSGLEDKATKRKSWLASTREDIKSALTEVKYERLGDDSFVKFRLADNVIVVNSDHPFVEEHSRSRAEKELTRTVAMVNLLTDVYALDIGVATGKLMSIREYRDKLMRYRAMQRRQSGTYIAKLLLQTQHDSEHNKRLEVVVSDALRYLGFQVQDLAKPGEPEGIALAYPTPTFSTPSDQDPQPPLYSFSFDAKASKHDSARTGNIKLDGVVEHRKRYQANYALIVAPGFQEGALATRCEQQKVTPMTAHDLGRLLEYTVENGATGGLRVIRSSGCHGVGGRAEELAGQPAITHP